jgi:hypothetical protein
VREGSGLFLLRIAFGGGGDSRLTLEIFGARPGRAGCGSPSEVQQAMMENTPGLADVRVVARGRGGPSSPCAWTATRPRCSA